MSSQVASEAVRPKSQHAVYTIGHSTRAAEELLVAPRTIETHLEHIFAKLGVQTRAEVAAWAARQDMKSATPAGRPQRPVPG